jgi:hypothetical protein
MGGAAQLNPPTTFPPGTLPRGKTRIGDRTALRGQLAAAITRIAAGLAVGCRINNSHTPPHTDQLRLDVTEATVG